MTKIYKRICDRCKTSYIGGGRMYCSKICSNKSNGDNRMGEGNHMWGKKHSPATIEKMRLKKIGKVMPIGTGEKIRKHHTGKKHSIKWNENISNSHKGVARPYFYGEKNPAWKGGITPINFKIRKSLEYKSWRESVFKRDNYTCRLCFKPKRGGDLHADHIKPFGFFKKLRFDVNNGRTLCISCHRKTKTYGGRLFSAKFKEK